MGADAGTRSGAPTDVAYGPRRIGHVNFFVSDFHDELDFLTGTCGFEETGRESNVRSAFVSNGNTHHDIGFIDIPGWQKHSSSRIVEGPAGRGAKPSLNHLGLEMNNEADLAAAYKRAIEAGMKPRITHNGTSKSNYIFDPWGTQYQFYADETTEWRKVFTGGESEFHTNPPWNPLAGTPSTESFWTPDPEIRRVESAPLHPVRVTHVVLQVSELVPHRDFLVHIGGFKEVAGEQGRVSYLAGTSSVYDMVLVQCPAGVEPTMHHASFELWPDEDLDRSCKELETRGVTVVRRTSTADKESLFVRDPSDLVLEFYVRRSEQPAIDTSQSFDDYMFTV